MKAVAWRETPLDLCYRIQIVSFKSKAELRNIFHDWKEVAMGWNIKYNDRVMIYSKKFKNEEEWTAWANKFPVPFLEKRMWGEKTTIIQHPDMDKKRENKNGV
jgi:hypothetical protein